MSTRLFLMDRYLNRSGLEISHKYINAPLHVFDKDNMLYDSYSHVYMPGCTCPLVIHYLVILQWGLIVINHVLVLFITHG